MTILQSISEGGLYSCFEGNGYVRIRTPYVYPDGEVIDLFFLEHKQIVTDLGETLRWLDMQSHYINLHETKFPHGIKLIDGMLQIEVGNDIASAVSFLSQIVIALSQLGALANS